MPVDPGLSRSFAGLRGAIVDATRAAQDRSDEVQHETNQSRHVASPTVARLGAIIRATTSDSNRHELLMVWGTDAASLDGVALSGAVIVWGGIAYILPEHGPHLGVRPRTL